MVQQQFRAILVLATLGALVAPAAAQDVIEMPPSASRVFTVPRPIGQLIQQNPEIARAAPIPLHNGETHIFVLYAHEAGTTNVVAIDQKGEEMFNTTVIVNEFKGAGLRMTTFW
jgi:Flp pilus assembly secretin CpaC